MGSIKKTSTKGTGGAGSTQRHKARKLGKADEAREAMFRRVIVEHVQGLFRSLYAAAEYHGMSKEYITIDHRKKNLTKPRNRAHEKQQLLTPPQEKILVKWIRFLGLAGISLNQRTIGAKVEALCDRIPSRAWILSFLRRNPEALLGRQKKLDHSRARAFNYTNVNDCFEKFQYAVDEHNITLRCCFNMDEIGAQVGGGRTSSNELYSFTEDDRQRYGLSSDNLETFTIIETIAADGSAFRPNTPERDEHVPRCLQEHEKAQEAA